MLVRKNLISNISLQLVVMLGIIIILPSCIIVKEKAPPPQTEQRIEMSKLRAETTSLLSNDLIVTPDSEIVTYKPKDWFFINTNELIKNETSGEIIAVAVNKEYTMAFIVSKVQMPMAMTKLIEDNEMIDLARLHFQQKKDKTTEQLFIASDYDLLPNGQNEIPIYAFTSMGNTQKVRVALLKTTTKKLYEFALVPLDFTSATPLTDKESLQLFQTILATTLF
jgi:hypothetical protein